MRRTVLRLPRAGGGRLSRFAGRAAGGRTANLGVGMIVPGAGYLSAGKPLRFLASVVSFVVSLVMWLGSGNVLAPVTVWLATAGGRTGAMTSAIPRPKRWFRSLPWRQSESGSRCVAARSGRPCGSGLHRNEFLKTLGANERWNRSSFAVKRESCPPVPELSADQLELARFALDRALQPVDEFEGL